jgi:hypothetical protein
MSTKAPSPQQPQRFIALELRSKGKMPTFVILDTHTSRLVDGFYFSEPLARNVARHMHQQADAYEQPVACTYPSTDDAYGFGFRGYREREA